MGCSVRSAILLLPLASICLDGQQYLRFAKSFGGSGTDVAYGIASDSAGNIYVAGETNSVDFPGAPASGTSRTNGDAFVVKLNPSGSQVLYKVILGGSGRDSARAIAVDSLGNAYITGLTNSPDFPVTSGAFQRSSGSPGTEDAFVVKLSPAGGIQFATYLGGSGSDVGYGLAIDSTGAAYITGSTSSTNFPVTGSAPQPVFQGGPGDCFVAKLSPTGSTLSYSTYLGGENLDVCKSIALDSQGSAFVTGTTSSVRFPSVAALQPGLRGSSNAFLTKLNPSGSFIFSTFLGGEAMDDGNAVSTDPAGNVFVGGDTASTTFPVTVGAVQSILAGAYDGFLCEVSNDGSQLLYCTYLGGTGSDSVTAITIGNNGQAVAVGTTASPNFPLATPFQPSFGGLFDGFVSVLSPDKSGWEYASFIGGGGDDRAFAITLLPGGDVAIAGQVLSGSVSYLSALTPTPAGQYDVLILKTGYPVIPRLVSFSPESGSGMSGVFHVVYSSPLGGRDISAAQILFSTSLSPAQGCQLGYLSTSNQFLLLNDAGTAWIPTGITPGSGSLSNNQCTLFGSGSSATVAGNQLSVTYNVQFDPAFAGIKTIWTNASSASSGLGSVMQSTVNAETLSWTVPDLMPVIVSLNPTSGIGTQQAFTATLGNPASIAAVYIMVSSAIQPQYSCYAKYDALANQFYIFADDGSSTSIVTPGSGSASSTQCTLSGPQAEGNQAGGNLSVTFPLSFSFGYAGVKSVFLSVQSQSNQSSGWRQLGAFTVVTANGGMPVCNFTGAPCVVSLSPANGTGPSGTFTGVFTHSGGASQHYLGYILFLPTPNIVWYTATGSCLVEYNRISNAMRLINDAGTNWLPGTIGLPIGHAGTLTNSHCSVNVGQSSASINGTVMTVNAAVSFNAGFTGQLATFMQGFDVTGAYTGMTQFGNWLVSRGTQAPGPYIVSLSPTSGAGSSTTLTFTAGHTSGVSSLSFVTMLISSVIVGGTPCQAFYWPSTNILNLVDDSGTAMVSANGITVGTAGTLSNSRCTINTGGATSSISGNNVTVSMPMTFSTANFGGTQKIYANAFDNYGKLSHWVTSGPWTVQ